MSTTATNTTTQQKAQTDVNQYSSDLTNYYNEQEVYANDLASNNSAGAASALQILQDDAANLVTDVENISTDLMDLMTYDGMSLSQAETTLENDGNQASIANNTGYDVTSILSDITSNNLSNITTEFTNLFTGNNSGLSSADTAQATSAIQAMFAAGNFQAAEDTYNSIGGALSTETTELGAANSTVSATGYLKVPSAWGNILSESWMANCNNPGALVGIVMAMTYQEQMSELNQQAIIEENYNVLREAFTNYINNLFTLEQKTPTDSSGNFNAPATTTAPPDESWMSNQAGAIPTAATGAPTSFSSVSELQAYISTVQNEQQTVGSDAQMVMLLMQNGLQTATQNMDAATQVFKAMYDTATTIARNIP